MANLYFLYKLNMYLHLKVTINFYGTCYRLKQQSFSLIMSSYFPNWTGKYFSINWFDFYNSLQWFLVTNNERCKHTLLLHTSFRTTFLNKRT